MKTKKTLILTLSALALTAATSQAATVTWDGGGGDENWSTSTNWSSDALPVAGDTVIISDGSPVLYNGNGGNLPNGLIITLSGGSGLAQNTNALRLQGSTITVGSGSTLGGGFWDLDGAILNFADGAIANMSTWENKATNSFNYTLGSAGFTTLAPVTFRIGGGSTIADATYTVDMASYTGGTGIITLMDFVTDAAAMDNTKFQGAGGLNVINNGGYTANLQWNDATEAIELNVTTAIPEPSLVALLGIGAVGLLVRRRRV